MYLLEFSFSNNLEIHVANTRKVVQDITLENILMNWLVKNWRLSDELSVLDGRIITKRFDRAFGIRGQLGYRRNNKES